MPFKDFYHNNANYYTENYSMGEFLFGYELEMFYDKSKHEEIIGKINDMYGLNIPDDWYEARNSNDKAILKNWGTDCTIHVRSNDVRRTGQPAEDFLGTEFKAPPIAATPSNLQKTIQLLDYLFKHGVYINETCGFHVHVSFPHLNVVDTCWIVSQLSVSGNYKKLKEFNGIQMEDEEWATFHHFEDLDERIHTSKKVSQTALLNEVKLSFFGDAAEKYDAIGQHPQGTIEWRGPRGFADQGHAVLVAFFTKALPSFIKLITQSLVATELVDQKGRMLITKKKFYEYFQSLDDKRPSDMTRNIKERNRQNKGVAHTFSKDMDMSELKEIMSAQPWVAKGKFRNLQIDSSGTMQNGVWYGGVFRGNLYGGTFDTNTAEWGSDAVLTHGWFIHPDGTDSYEQGNIKDVTFQGKSIVKVVK